MARECAVTGKSTQVGGRYSNRTRATQFNPVGKIRRKANLQKRRVFIPETGESVVVVDFAPHDLEFLRAEHAHRRLGFSDREVASWFRASGLAPSEPRVVSGEPLDVVVWVATRTPGAAHPNAVSRGDAENAESSPGSASSASPRENASQS